MAQRKQREAQPFDDPAIQPIPDFDGARDAASPAERLRELRKRAERFRERMLDGPRVRYLASFDLVRVPYPVRYGLRDAATTTQPMMHLMNRLFIVQVDSDHGRRTVLVSPSDPDANAETPYFKRLEQRMGPLRGMGRRVIAPRIRSVSECLQLARLTPEDVDYITYDHLHTQDLRPWLGSHGRPGLFPRARLLVTHQEWANARELVAPQADWYCPGGTDGIDPERVIRFDRDVTIGHGLALMRTPGHTEGNHSIVTHTTDGLFVTSENGVGPDAYAPARSHIAGLSRYAHETGMEVVLNGNTLERSLDQYLSMIQEKVVAGPSVRHPAFPNLLCSSEMASWWAFPGIKPTFTFGEVRYGQPTRPTGASPEAA